MTRRVVIYFAVTFLLGVFAGSGGSVLWKKYRHWNRPPLEERIVRHLQRELSLSQEQSRQVQQIISGSMEKLSEIRENMESEHDLRRQETREQIKEILASEQKERFEEMIRDFDERHRRRRERRQRN